jgi:hypothetical protein
MNRRVAILSATCAVVLGATGIAVATTRGGGDRQLEVVEKRVRAATTDETPTTLSTTTAPDLTTTTSMAIPAPVATTTAPREPSGLEGTLTMSSTTLVADQPVAFTLTLRNSTAEDVQLAPFPLLPLGVWIDSPFHDFMAVPIVAEPGDSLAPGEVRTRTMMITPRPEMVGQATVRLAYIHTFGREFWCRCGLEAYANGIPPVPISIVPPGWVKGQPLEPSQGSWSVTMSASSNEVRVGDVVTVNSTVRNTGSQPQKVGGYGSLAIQCTNMGGENWSGSSQLIGDQTLEPGEAHTFSLDFSFPEALTYGVQCDVGMSFDNSVWELQYGLESDVVSVSVLPALEPSTTTTTP